MPDDCNAISDNREQSHSATVSTQPQQQELQPQSIMQRPDPFADKRSTTSNNRSTISRPEQSHPATAETPAPTQFDRARPEPAESEREQSLDATASTPAPQKSQLQSTEPASEPMPDRDRDRHPIATENQSDRPEQSHPTTASTPAQQELQSQSATPVSEPLPDCDRPEQSTAETPAPTQSDRDRPESDRPEQSSTETASPPASSPRSFSEFPEWMTAKQAFQALGGDPGDRNSSVSSIDGLKRIKFSTFKSKTSSELKPFGLELSQDRKRRRQPCYRLLKPSDEEILQLIRDLDQQLRTDNYLPIFHLREKLQPPLSRDELDRALYRLERNDLIELSALQEVIAYTPEQIDAGIPQNIGGRLFFIIMVDP